MNNKKITLSLVFNFLILIGTIFGLSIDGYHHSVYVTQGIDVSPFAFGFRYYTTLTNVILAIVAVVYIVYDLLLIGGRFNKMPKWVSILKLCATAGTTITMLVVIFLLTPGILLGLANFPNDFLYSGTSIIYHVITPTLGILTFILFETNREIKLVHCSFGTIFTEVYSIFYILDALFHFLPTYDATSHDWYFFVSIVTPKLVVPMMFIFAGFAFLITWLLWLANRKIHIWEKTATM